MQHDQDQRFAEKLKHYRHESYDQQSGKRLTLERCCELLTELAGRRGVYSSQLSKWENNSDKLQFPQDRELILALIHVYHACGGLQQVAEGDVLLNLKGLIRLQDEEIARIDSDWQRESSSLVQRVRSYFRPKSSLQLFDSTCGNQPIDLATQRLHVTRAFGAYFAGLLEREHHHIQLAGQIHAPILMGQAEIAPLSRILYALQKPRGQHLVIIAADGGMGKSTLAARLVRCLYAEFAADVILGDSAKSERVDPKTGKLIPTPAGYSTVNSFIERLAEQLGVPFTDTQQTLRHIRARLSSRRALIVVDNLETLQHGSQLLTLLEQLAGRDTRIIVTTRTQVGLQALTRRYMLVTLQPVIANETLRHFATWHTQQFDVALPSLDDEQLTLLARRSGGNPLLIQLLLNDVSRYSWAYLEEMPTLFSYELLNFLYAQRWQELTELGATGVASQRLLCWMATQQLAGETLTFERIAQWAMAQTQAIPLPDLLPLLTDRFLVVRPNPDAEHLALFPSLVEFVMRQPVNAESH